MTTRLASESIRITLDGNPVELVPSLRAALRLARRYGTFGALVAKISAGSVEAIADTVAEGADRPTVLPIILKEIEKRGVLSVLAYLQPVLVDFVIALAGPASRNEGSASTGEPITFDAYHEQLFEIATGMLGWSPRDAWSATPAEIMSAHKGRVAMLKMIFGSGENTDQDKPAKAQTLDQKAKLFFAGMGTRLKKRAA